MVRQNTVPRLYSKIRMALIETQRFGAMEYDLASEIHFPHGLPGFHEEHRFILIERTALAPILFLQSLETPALCFAALPASAIDASYELQLSGEDAAVLVHDQESP